MRCEECNRRLRPTPRGHECRKCGYEVIEMDDEMVADFELLREEFRQRFGREPGEDDPVFWDDDASGDEPVPMSAEKMRRRMMEAGVRAGFDDEAMRKLLAMVED